MAINSEIINQYGQLIGEYSRLDDELWFSKPEEDDHIHHDDQIVRVEEGLESNFAPSYEYTVHQEQPSQSINNPASDGGITSVKETSSSLNDSSLDQSQTSSPVSVLQRKRSHSSVNEKATKHGQTASGCPLKCHSPKGLQSTGPTITRIGQSQSIQPASYSESSRLDDETPEGSPTKPVRMRKVSDLLRLGSGDNQANNTNILESHLRQGFKESGSWEKEQNRNAKFTSKRKKQKVAVKKCTHCESTKTPQWREGPMGRATLCNACGVQYKKGRLFSEYRPVKSPTFDPSLHSNFEESGSWVRERNPKPKPIPERKEPKVAVKKCMHCESTDTPWWREGPMGHATLCNACGVQYRKGRLISEDRPLESPTFNLPLHSNMEESGSWEREEDSNPKPTPKGKKPKVAIKKCMHCGSTDTPHWREGPMGYATLCDACSVQHRKGRLFSQDRPLESPKFNLRLHSNMEESGSWEREEDPNPKPTPKRKKPKAAVKKCMHCESTKTPQWREGPMGHATLCNACGVQYRHGRLFPEYRPLKSPGFDPALHSHLPKQVQRMRMRKNAEISVVPKDSE